MARKLDPKLCMRSWLTIDFDDTPVLFYDDVMSDRQPESCPLPSRLCRKEGIKHFFLYSPRNPGTIVANAYFDTFTKIFFVAAVRIGS